MSKKTLLTLTFVLLIYIVLPAQVVDLDRLLHFKFKGKPVKISGGINATSKYIQTNDPNNRLQPYTYSLGGNLSLNYLNFSLPINFSYTNQKFTHGYQSPFKINRTAFHPKYKAVTAHLGDISMSLSPYTMSGLVFTGMGVDVNTKKIPFKFSIFYGRFLKATPLDSGNLAAYERWGWGFKTDYISKRNSFSFAIFHARDKENSLAIPLDSILIYPKENICYSLGTKTSINPKIDITLDYSNSILTRDTRLRSNEYLKNPISQLIITNLSTQIFNAFKTSINYKTKKTKYSVAFEHIDPDYKTLGALYFNNDFENLTFSVNRSFLNNKLNVNTSIGIQKDNLKNIKLRSTKRMVGSFNAAYQVGKKLSLNATYSTFQTYSQMKSQFENINNPSQTQLIDTLQFVQLSNNASFNINYGISQSKIRKQNINTNISMQKATDKENGFIKSNKNNIILNGNIAYQLQYTPWAIGFTSAFNCTYLLLNNIKTITIGPVISANHSIKKLNLSNILSLMYNSSSVNGKQNMYNLSIRFASNYTMFKKHKIGLSISKQIREIHTNKIQKIDSFLGTLNYSYSF